MKFIGLIFIILLFAALANCQSSPFSRAQKVKKEFEERYLKQKPFSNYIASVQLVNDNNEFSLLVILASNPTPEDAPQFPRSFQGLKVIYKVETVVCPMDVKQCDDGKTTVSRKGPRCEFEECPKTPPKPPLLRFNVGFFILMTIVICGSVMGCLLLCCCCVLAIARRHHCKRLKELQTNEHVDATPLQEVTTPLSQTTSEQQPQQSTPQVFYYQPTMPFFAQPMPFAENGLYPGYTPMMVVVPQTAPSAKQQGFTPISDEEYARQLQAQYDKEARNMSN